MLFQQALVVTLEIAGVACRLNCDDQAFAARLAARYADFPAGTEPAVTLDVTLTGPVSLDVAATWSGPYARVRGAGASIMVEGVGFTAEYDESTARGWIGQPPDFEPLETVLTAVYASRLLAAGGCMLHAASIVGRAGALVFFGPSGSGKTTVTELVGHDVVTDEITAIRPTAHGYVVSSVPWRGTPRTAPLAGLLRLEQAQKTALTRLSPIDTVRHLMGSVFLCRKDADEFARILETAAVLARTVPAYGLEFTRDRRFWEVVEGGVAA